jgi:predicted transposase YbfD/YdcC
LYEDVECAFKVHSGHSVNETVEANHGRIETRRCHILPAGKYLMGETVARWKGLATIVRIVSTREIKGHVTQDIRYYISDEKETNAAYFNALARGHWGIENQLHWVLDVNFKEDSCRARSGYAPQNLSVLRKMALQIVSNQKDKLSIKKRTYKAALDIGYLKKLIEF